MNTYEIVYLIIFLLVILIWSFGTGFFIRHIWFKCLAFIERAQKWKRDGGKW